MLEVCMVLVCGCRFQVKLYTALHLLSTWDERGVNAMAMGNTCFNGEFVVFDRMGGMG